GQAVLVGQAVHERPEADALDSACHAHPYGPQRGCVLVRHCPDLMALQRLAVFCVAALRPAHHGTPSCTCDQTRSFTPSTLPNTHTCAAQTARTRTRTWHPSGLHSSRTSASVAAARLVAGKWTRQR